MTLCTKHCITAGLRTASVGLCLLQPALRLSALADRRRTADGLLIGRLDLHPAVSAIWPQSFG
jgi:hypothetical protein